MSKFRDHRHFTRCLECGELYPVPPPLGVRADMRARERAAKQMRLW